MVGFAEVGNLVAEVEEEPDDEESGEADQEVFPETTDNIAVQGAAKRVEERAESGQETDSREDPWSGLLGTNSGVRKAE